MQQMSQAPVAAPPQQPPRTHQWISKLPLSSTNRYGIDDARPVQPNAESACRGDSFGLSAGQILIAMSLLCNILGCCLVSCLLAVQPGQPTGGSRACIPFALPVCAHCLIVSRPRMLLKVLNLFRGPHVPGMVLAPFSTACPAHVYSDTHTRMAHT